MPKRKGASRAEARKKTPASKRQSPRRSAAKPLSPLQKIVAKVKSGKVLTPKQFQTLQESSAAVAKRNLEKAKALKAVSNFKPKKADKGKIVFIGTKGSRNPHWKNKDRKGYTVYVDAKGKPHLLKQPKTAFKATAHKNVQVKVTKRTRKAAKEFQQRRRVLTKKGEAIVRGKGEIITGKKGADFNDTAINKLAASIKKAIEAQASHRIFIISAKASITLPDGTSKVIDVAVDIAKADHISIKIGGLRNFVRQKFYAFMARELAYLGYVTSGSDNHIRNLRENKGKARDKWTKGGMEWEGRYKEVVRLEALEWKIEKAE